MKSGYRLIIYAIILALLPALLELITGGGPSKFGDPETGFAMIFSGIVLWPIAFIMFIIGIKRIIFDN